jgi:hypothetical protein
MWYLDREMQRSGIAVTLLRISRILLRDMSGKSLLWRILVRCSLLKEVLRSKSRAILVLKNLMIWKNIMRNRAKVICVDFEGIRIIRYSIEIDMA